MESATVLRSVQYAISTSSQGVLKKPCKAALANQASGGKTILFTNRHKTALVSCVKASTTSVTAMSSGESNGVVLPASGDGLLDKKTPFFSATFPKVFETLIEEVCEETEIAQLKLKFGSFEMQMKRNIESPAISTPVVAQTMTPPIAVEPANEPTLPAPPKSSSEKVTPFTNISPKAADKLATLEASGSNRYVTVSSPMVGTFRRGRTLKGKKQPPACKEGGMIKERQVIGFVDQFGTEIPIKSDVAGEVVKILYNDGEAVGYGDPLIAVLPSFS